MKFVLYFDYKASYKPMYYEYKEMESKTLEEAIKEADNMWNENVYLARIMKKDGRQERTAGVFSETYKAILCRRTVGWYQNTKENHEEEHYAQKCWTKNTSAWIYAI